MAKDISGPKSKLLKKFNGEVRRARHLEDLIIRRGYYTDGGPSGPFRRLRVTEQRDIAEYIAFEAATGFEHFSREVFILAARKQYGVQPSRAEYIMGTVDRGLTGVTGWGAPAHVKKRANALFGRRHFIAKLDAELPTGCYDVLIHAHKIRNRIAHQAGRQSPKMETTYSYARVPREPEADSVWAGSCLTIRHHLL